MNKPLIFLILLIGILLISFGSAFSVTYNFSSAYENINMFARSATACTVYPPNTGPIPSNCGAITDISTDSALDKSDNTFENTVSTSGKYAMQMFIGNLTAINFSEISALNWSYEGLSSASGIKLYWWNNNTLVWDLIDGITTERTSSNYSSSINYINTTGYTHLLVENNKTSEFISVDFVQLTIYYDDFIVNSPTQNQQIANSLSTTLNTSQVGYNQSVWYSLNNGIKNYSFCNDANNCQDTIIFPRHGYYNLSIWSNKSSGLVNREQINNLYIINRSKLLVKDTYISDAATSTNYGTSTTLYVAQGGGTGDEFKSLFWANFSGLKNSNNIILNVTINWFLEQSGGDTRIYNVSKLMKKFNDTNASWLRANQSTLWSKAGLNHSDFNSSLLYQGSATDEVYYTWELNKTLLEDWFNDESINYGLIFMEKGASGNSRDHTLTSAEGTATQIPYFNITMINLNQLGILEALFINNSNYSISTIDFQFNISDDNDYLNNISLFLDNSLNTTYYYSRWINTTINNTFNFTLAGIADGVHTFYIQAYDSDGAQSNSSVLTFTKDTTAPLIIIDYPSDYDTFSYKTNINVNFTSLDGVIGTQACWWSNVSGVVNNTITCGTNISVSETGDGDYQVDIWSNDSLNNIGHNLIHYTISMNKPAIVLKNPEINKYLNYNKNILFNFTATDSNGIDRCDLYGNWTGSFILNQSIYTIVSGDETDFNLINLSDGNYFWNVRCNDTTNQFNFAAANRTFILDTLTPGVSISNIVSVAGSQTITIIHNETDINLNNTSCKFSIYNLSGGVDNLNNNLSCTANTQTSATVSRYSTYNLTMYVYDLAGNFNYTTSTFVTTASGTTITGGSSGGTTVIVGSNDTAWLMTTESGNNFYEVSMTNYYSPTNTRTRYINFKNLGTRNHTITLSCEGDFCSNVLFLNKTFLLPVSKTNIVSIPFKIISSENLSNGDYSFNVIAIDELQQRGVISVRVTIGLTGILTENINKLISSKDIGGIQIPYIIILLLVFSIIALFLGLILKNKSWRLSGSLVGSLFLSFLVLFFI